MNAWGVHGSTTTHGGTVNSTQNLTSVDTDKTLRAGDGFFCPLCKVWSTLIKSNDFIIIDGKPVAFVGDEFTCGAKLLDKQNFVLGEKANNSINVQKVYDHQQENFISKQEPKDSVFDEQFLLKTDSGDLLVEVPYTVVREDGTVSQGITDKEVKTLRIETNKSELLKVYIGHFDL